MDGDKLKLLNAVLMDYFSILVPGGDIYIFPRFKLEA